jgi:hypothetical protein
VPEATELSLGQAGSKKDVVSPLRIAVLNLPTPVLGCFHLVRYYLNAVEASEALAEDRTDDRLHAAAEVSMITTRESYESFLPGHNYHRYIISFAKFVETLESIIDFDV